MPCPLLLIGLSVHMSGYVPRLKRHQSEGVDYSTTRWYRRSDRDVGE